MTLVHTAYVTLKPEMWTPCPDAPDYADTPAHKPVVGDEDQYVWCFYCKAVAWSTWQGGATAGASLAEQQCEHGRIRSGPPCPKCPCPYPGGHQWAADAAAVGVKYCQACHAARADGRPP